MNILLINPMFTMYGGVKGHGGSSPPLNLGYLAAYVRSQNPHYTLSILDAEALQLTYEEIAQHIRRIRPDVVGMTANTPAFHHVVTISELCKSLDKTIRIVVGGPHPSGLPEETVTIAAIDYVVVGEGEKTFEELLRVIETDGDLDSVDGILYKNNGRIVRNQSRLLIEDLDSLPFPARDLMPHHLYTPAPTKRVSNFHATSICSARGCPFSCTFCGANLIWGKKYRYRSPSNVIAEIEQCMEMDIREFNFTDELFTANRERLRQLCEEIIRKDLHIAFTCMSRVGDFVDDEILLLMKQAGCKQISFGIESGSQDVLDLMNKKITLNAARNSIKHVKKTGIKTHASYMIGNIGDTRETIQATIEFAKELDTDIAAFFVTSPLPGTALWHQAKSQGYVRQDFEWIDFSPLSKASSPVLNLPSLSSQEIKYWHSRAIRDYYLRPHYIIKRLRGLRSWVELKNLLNGLKLFFRLQ